MPHRGTGQALLDDRYDARLAASVANESVYSHVYDVLPSLVRLLRQADRRVLTGRVASQASPAPT
jgi:hypothetical protein